MSVAERIASFQRGWLSPTGEFVPCDHYGHARAIYQHSHLTESAAEQAGWWRLTGLLSPVWLGWLAATPEQRRFLLKWHADNGLEKPNWTFFLPQGHGGQPAGVAPADSGGGVSEV